MATSYLTHKAATDAPDQNTMHLKGMDDTTVTVFFDGDEENDATMDHPTYDKLTEGPDWECVGFKAA